MTLIVLGLALVTGCSDDECPVCPEDKPPHVPDYHLVYSFVGPAYPAYVITYSTKTGNIVDSTYYPGDPFSNLVFSHDGEYACYTSNYNLELGSSETWVTRTATGDTVSYVKGIGALAAYLSKDDKYLLLTGGSNIAILHFPSLEVVYRDSVISLAGTLHPSRKLPPAAVGCAPREFPILQQYPTSAQRIIAESQKGFETATLRLSKGGG